MDERKPEERKGDHLKLAPPSLKAAIRRARVESAEQAEAVYDLRQAEITRLELVEEAIRPVVDQTPEGVDLFDVGIAHGDHPRLFLDMISFVDLAHDRRTYRFYQDTRHGRVLIAEGGNMDRIVAAMTNYIARRLVEREQALAADSRAGPVEKIDAKAVARAKKLIDSATAGHAPAKPKRGVTSVVADIFLFLLTTLGAFALVGLVALAGIRAWNLWGRALWEAKVGPAPF